MTLPPIIPSGFVLNRAQMQMELWWGGRRHSWESMESVLHRQKQGFNWPGLIRVATVSSGDDS